MCLWHGGQFNYLHHEDLLLDDAKVVALLQLDHLDGRELAGRDAF